MNYSRMNRNYLFITNFPKRITTCITVIVHFLQLQNSFFPLYLNIALKLYAIDMCIKLNLRRHLSQEKTNSNVFYLLGMFLSSLSTMM